MTTHDLKTWPGPFSAVADGRKRFEVRRCHDRTFAVGDALLLREWQPVGSFYTGREATARVTYIAGPAAWGLPDDVVVLGIDEPVVAPGRAAGGEGV